MINSNELIRGLLLSNIEFLEGYIVGAIELDYAKLAVQNVLGKLKETVTILTDENPENRDQLKVIWGHLLADAQIAESVRGALLDAASKINNEALKEGLAVLVEPVVQTIVAVSDTEANNDSQLETVWTSFIRSEAFVSVVEKNLEVILTKLIPNQPTVVTLLVSLLRIFLKPTN